MTIPSIYTLYINEWKYEWKNYHLSIWTYSSPMNPSSFVSLHVVILIHVYPSYSVSLTYFHHHTHLLSFYTHRLFFLYPLSHILTIIVSSITLLVYFFPSPSTWSLSLLTNSLASDAIHGDVYQYRRKRMLDSPSRKVQPRMLLLTWRIDR